MRADRLVSILLLLQVNKRMTSRELAQRLEVSERTIHRDMEALSASGIPIMAERGIHGGWHLLDGYQTNLTGLNEAEIQALFISTPPHLLADLGLNHASEAALIKLLAALPAISRRDAEDIRQRIHIDVPGWNRPEESVPFLPILQEAIWQERKLQLAYKRGDGTSVERVVDPLGLVAKGTVWYLVSAVEGELRTYRVSRIQDAAITADPCTRPPDFDLAVYWEQSSAQFTANLPRYPAKVRVEATMLDRLQSLWRYARVEHMSDPDDDGRLTCAIMFDTEDVACEYILGFGPFIEVLEPLALREMVIDRAKRLLAFYEQRQAGS